MKYGLFVVLAPGRQTGESKMKRVLTPFLLALCTCALVACSDDESNNGTTDDAGTNNQTTPDAGEVDMGEEEVVVGSDCVEGCGNGFCVTTDDGDFCTKACATDGDCPDDYACLDSGPAENPNFCGVAPEEAPPLTYLRPRDETILTLDRTEISLRWNGGEPPYVIEFGDDGASLQELGSVMGNEFLVSVADEGLVAGSSYAWRVTATGGEQPEEGPIWTFSTVEIDLPECNLGSTIEHGGRDYDLVLVGTTCWFASNLTIGVDSGDRTVNDEILEKLCPVGDCERSAYYTGYEIFQFYSEDAVDLDGRTPVACPDGWTLPTQAQVEEVAATLSSQQLAGFFPLEGYRSAGEGMERLDECVVTGEFDLCTNFLDAETDVNASYLWIDGAFDNDNGMEYAVIERANGDSGMYVPNFGQRYPSFGHAVRCVIADGT
jgi:uncharacterized protein (TIGR02145 family)